MNLKLILQGIRNDLALTADERCFIENLSAEYKSWEKSLSKQEKYLIRKYTLNSHDNKKPNRFFERLNRVLRGDYAGSDKDKLFAYGQIISKAICSQPITQQIVCYRGVDDDLMSDIAVGTIFKFGQFISTSIIENGALKKRFKYVILAPKGTKGAYIENISAFKGQYEFLLDYNCEFKLTAKNGRVIYLEVIV